MTDKQFKPGDFITFQNKPGAFAIYEGNDISTTYKRYSLVLSYNPKKYVETSEGYQTKPMLEYSTMKEDCNDTIEDDHETYWSRLCTTSEKENATRFLEEHGYSWDETTLTLMDKNTGQIITKVKQPKWEYNGEIIKHTTTSMRNLLKQTCINKNKRKEYAYSYADDYPNNSTAWWNKFGNYYDDYWDY